MKASFVSRGVVRAMGSLSLLLLAATASASSTSLDGYSADWDTQQHVNYVNGKNGHVYELMFDTSWHLADLMVAAGVPGLAVAPTSPVVGYTSPWNNQQHVDFIGTDGHVHELMFDTSWHPSDLTSTAGGTSPIAGSPLIGFVSLWDDQQHVDFIGTDNQVHELMFDTSWHPNNLMVGAGIPSAVVAAGSRLAGYGSTAVEEYVACGPHNRYLCPVYSNQKHVDYVGTDGHVHELMYDTSWHPNDLMVAAGIPGSAAIVESGMDGYWSAWNNQQHVNYIGTDGHVHELMYDTSWHPSDLMVEAGIPSASVKATVLVGYTSAWNEQQHVNYVGGDGHVHELMFDTSWHPSDLMVAAGIPNAGVTVGTSLGGYTSGWNNQQHVDYLGTDGNVYELVYGTSWGHNAL